MVYPVEALLGYAGLFFGLSMITVSLSGSLAKNSHVYIEYALGVSASVLGIAALTQLAGFGPSLIYTNLFKANVSSSLLFNLTGSNLVGASVSLTALVVGLVALAKRTKRPVAWLVMLPPIAVGLAIQIWAMLPGKPAQLVLPPWTASWSIALDAMRQPRAALIGQGVSNYSNLYTQLRPAWINGTKVWDVQFGQANDIILTLLPTMGIVGTGLWLWFMVACLGYVKKNNSESAPLVLAAVTILVVLLFLPPNPVVFTILAVILAGVAAQRSDEKTMVRLETQSSSQEKNLLSRLLSRQTKQAVELSPFTTVVSLVVIVLGAISLYFVGLTLWSQVYAYRAAQAAVSNKPVDVYEFNKASVKYDQWLDVNRRRYALTNLLIASALSNKTNLSEQENQQMIGLLQQAIREARAATTLDPQDTQNWQVLAQIYQNMSTSAPDAKEWAVQSLVKAIETSPVDPSLRITLGGIFLANNQASQAIPFFQQAVQLKPDMPNAHYNLALALTQVGALNEAKTSYQNVLNLLKPGTDEVVVVTKQIEDLDKLIAKTKEATTSAKKAGSQTITSQNVTENPDDTVRNPAQTQIPAAPSPTAISPTATPAAASPTPNP